MKDNKGFWDRWAKRYDTTMKNDQRTYARIANRMKQTLNRNMTVLELACGTGLLSERLAGSVKLLEATDFSEEMIREAKSGLPLFVCITRCRTQPICPMLPNPSTRW